MWACVRFFFFLLFVGFYCFSSFGQTMVISGIVNHYKAGVQNSVIELHVINDINDLSQYELKFGFYLSDNSIPFFTFPSDTIYSNSCISLATDSTWFRDFFGFNATYILTENIISPYNLGLYRNDELVDQYGDDTDGWQVYGNMWVHRKSNTNILGSDFNRQNWVLKESAYGFFNEENDDSISPFPNCSFETNAEGSYSSFLPKYLFFEEDTIQSEVTITSIQPNLCSYDLVVLPNSTATIGDDFMLDSITQIVPANSDSLFYSIPISILDDTIPEGEESIWLKIESTSNDSSCTIGADSLLQIIISDNQYTQMTLSQVLERDSDGELIHFGESLEFTASNQCVDIDGGPGLELYVQDGDSGIMLHSNLSLIPYTPNKGALLKVKGILGIKNGVPALELDAIEDLGPGTFFSWFYDFGDSLSADNVGQRMYLAPASYVNTLTDLMDEPGFYLEAKTYEYLDYIPIPFVALIDQESELFNTTQYNFLGMGGICLPFPDSLQTVFMQEYYLLPCYLGHDFFTYSSTNDPQLKTQVTIFPNPASDQLNIEIEDLNPQSIRVYNALGQLELLELNPQAQMQLNVSKLIAGMHYFEITFEEGTVVKPVMIR